MVKMGVELTTISQLGSRKSICSLHVKRLLENSPLNTKHIFYIVDDKNPELNEYAKKELIKYGKVFYKKENPLLLKRHKNLPPLGGDKNYDWLISKVETEYFLTLHDDTILFDSNSIEWVTNEIEGGKDFGGFTDGRVHSNYETLFYKNIPFSKIRIGTWFLYGKKEPFETNKMSMGFYKNVFKYSAAYMLGKNTTTSKLRQWVNGGFPFNVSIKKKLSTKLE